MASSLPRDDPFNLLEKFFFLCPHLRQFIAEYGKCHLFIHKFIISHLISHLALSRSFFCAVLPYLFLNCFVDLRNFVFGKLRARFGIVYEGAAVIIIKGQTAMQQLKSLLLHAAFVLSVIIHRKFIIKFSAVIIHYEKNSLHDGTAIGHIQAICFDL